MQFLGEVRRDARNELLSGALALVHMTTRPERFGLTMIEAMACGTPVLGARMGSIPEIVVDGSTGFLCDTVDDAVAKVPRLAALDRRACRARVEAEFTVERMVDRYWALTNSPSHAAYPGRRRPSKYACDDMTGGTARWATPTFRRNPKVWSSRDKRKNATTHTARSTTSSA